MKMTLQLAKENTKNELFYVDCYNYSLFVCLIIYMYNT